LYFLDLIEYRLISNEIASRFNVIHQSPQMIVLKNGVAIYNASHESIDANNIKQLV
jgi:bacillithiol system protein YtxJ